MRPFYQESWCDSEAVFWLESAIVVCIVRLHPGNVAFRLFKVLIRCFLTHWNIRTKPAGLCPLERGVPGDLGHLFLERDFPLIGFLGLCPGFHSAFFSMLLLLFPVVEFLEGLLGFFIIKFCLEYQVLHNL